MLAAITDSQPLAAFEQWLDEVRNPQVEWRSILNNSTSQRPKDRGGSLFRALADLFDERVLDHHRFICTLNMPCSFEADDGLQFQVTQHGRSASEARNATCKLAFAMLLRRKPDWIIVRAGHWNIYAEDFAERLQNFVEGVEPIRIERASGGRTSRYEAPSRALQGTRDEMIFQILKGCLLRRQSLRSIYASPFKGRCHNGKCSIVTWSLENFVNS